MDRVFPVGKLPLDFLNDLLTRLHGELAGPYGCPDDRVILGAAIGEDAAVIDMGDRYLVVKTDPITFATDQIGWYAVHVNANDLAVTGAIPRWFLATVLLPEGRATRSLVEDIFEQIRGACDSLGISLVGGHTEVTYGLDRPIVVGHLLGEVEGDALIKTSGARPGDALLLVRGVAIEGASIITREKADELRTRGYDREFIDRVKGFLFYPGISVLREARMAVHTARIHSMHDPTEGGVATGLWEMALAAGVGLWVDGAKMPVLPECQRLCAEYGLDPLGLIASGALLLAVHPEDVSVLMSAYKAVDVPCAVIGEVREKEEGVVLWEEGEARELPRFDADEITKLFA